MELKEYQKIDFSKFDTPIAIGIKNLTNAKLYDVKVFDFEHEKQNKISYVNEYSDTTYNDILRRLTGYSEPKFNICVIQHCAYSKKYTKEQVRCGITILEKEINGSVLSKHLIFSVSKKQYQQSISLLNVNIPFYICSNIIYDFLMPNTSISLNLFYKKNRI